MRTPTDARDPMKCSVCGGYSSSVTCWSCIQKTQPSTFVGIEPTIVSVDEEILRAAVSAVESGIEYALEVLTTHEATLGRTLARHKREAQAIENDIRRLNESQDALRRALGWTLPE